MSRKVKCKKCGKIILNTEAYKVVKGNKNEYYCNIFEYENIIKEKAVKDECMRLVTEVFNVKYCVPMIVKELNNLRKYYDYETIISTFKDKETRKTIDWFLSENEICYGTVRYVFTIIENNIDKIFKQRKKELEQIEKMLNGSAKNTIDIDIMNDIINYNKPKEIKYDDNDISQWLDD